MNVNNLDFLEQRTCEASSSISEISKIALSSNETTDVGKKISEMNLIEPDSIEHESGEASSSVSEASEDSFHSADDEQESSSNSSPQHRITEVIEPDGNDGAISDSTPSEERDFINGMKPQDSNTSPDEEDEEEFLNEEHLKDLEVSMTQEEKDEKREESKKYKECGNNKFKEKKYIEAVADYTSGLRICPLSFPKDRAILLSNRAAAKAKVDMKKEAIKDCSKAIELHDVYTKAILRRATLNEETEELDDALQDFKRVLELDPYNQEALQAIRRLPDMIAERNEKLKEEMMGKLKDLGNMILRPFGLSTNNFELRQDPNTGGYNINFKQNG
ncbi:cytochrome c oxidase subunit 1 [Halocaridina rubra]|uniref:Cytochrome c oxidase subunit 1 n=1 Tax=Halocaridina rubra TaxID=373956 RepID=A0AAN8WJB2_HALRR